MGPKERKKKERKVWSKQVWYRPGLEKNEAVAERVVGDAVAFDLDADDAKRIEGLAQLIFVQAARKIANEQTTCAPPSTRVLG